MIKQLITGFFQLVQNKKNKNSTEITRSFVKYSLFMVLVGSKKFFGVREYVYCVLRDIRTLEWLNSNCLR